MHKIFLTILNSAIETNSATPSIECPQIYPFMCNKYSMYMNMYMIFDEIILLK